MLSALKKALASWTTSRPKEPAEIPLFAGSAYFSTRVPKIFSEKWVAHGGTISSGTTWDVRARYFFAIDPSEPWVTKLFAKSVTVFHAGWIAHCIDQAFRVPIAEYILDDRFITEPPYKFTGNFTPPIFIPLSEPTGLMDTDSGETGPTLVQTPDTPSTPISMPRKRKREQAYFDSPTSSLVFSGFDKDGIPRRPRKLRKLRFDPSFSPRCGRSNKEAMEGASLDLYTDPHDRSGDNEDEIRKEHEQVAGSLHGRLTTVRSPDIPDIFRTNKETSPTHPSPSYSLDEQLSKTTLVSSSAISIDKKERMLPVRTIDFTNLPPRTRRPGAGRARSGVPLSVIKSTDNKIKTPKKISFASHARVRVYTVSRGRPGSKDDAGARSTGQCLDEHRDCEDGPMLDDGIRGSNDEVKGSDDSPTEVTTGLSARIDDGPARSVPNEDQSENDTLTLTTGDVEAMRRRLLESAVKNGVDSGQLATLFEPGKTYQGMVFRHEW